MQADIAGKPDTKESLDPQVAQQSVHARVEESAVRPLSYVVVVRLRSDDRRVLDVARMSIDVLEGINVVLAEQILDGLLEDVYRAPIEPGAAQSDTRRAVGRVDRRHAELLRRILGGTNAIGNDVVLVAKYVLETGLLHVIRALARLRELPVDVHDEESALLGVDAQIILGIAQILLSRVKPVVPSLQF